MDEQQKIIKTKGIIDEFPTIPFPKFGVNLIGSAVNNSGIGELLRTIYYYLIILKIPFSVISLTDIKDIKSINTSTHIHNELIYPINIIAVNAQGWGWIPEEYLIGHYNIGVWKWELEKFRPEWGSLEYCDEIWTIGNSLRDVIAEVCKQPVFSFRFYNNQRFYNYIDEGDEIRKEFSIPEDCIMFSFIFDYASIFERKNPAAIIKAFKLAFSNQENIRLIIKTSNYQSYPRERNDLMKLAKLDHRIIVIEEIKSYNWINKLLNTTDIYISLHRSEGLGFTILEAMNHKCAIIATGYGIFMEYINIESIIPIGYKKVQIVKNYPSTGIYDIADCTWAEPGIMEASEWMRKLYLDHKLIEKYSQLAYDCIKNVKFESDLKKLERRLFILHKNLVNFYPVEKVKIKSKSDESFHKLINNYYIFDEFLYLSNNQDVLMAKNNGILESGYQHFINNGINESRISYWRKDPVKKIQSWLRNGYKWDSEYYRRANKTIFNADKIPGDSLRHFCEIGKYRNFSYNLIEKENEELIKWQNEYNSVWNNYLEKTLKYKYKNLVFKDIPKDSDKFAVTVEPRCHPHLEIVLKNFMYYLKGKGWGLQIFHGNKNEEFVKKVVRDWAYVHLENLGIDDLSAEPALSGVTQNAYNLLLKSSSFWEKVKGEKVLIFQVDTLLRKSNIEDFLQHDYIGAPWPDGASWKQLDIPVGNGGLSIRTKKVMNDICKKYNDGNLSEDYRLHEDGFFSKYCTIDGHKIADMETAKKFSVETIYYEDPLGLHAPKVSMEQLKKLLYNMELN